MYQILSQSILMECTTLGEWIASVREKFGDNLKKMNANAKDYKDRIKRLWDNNYLDNLYRSAFAGMISNVITIILSFTFLFCDICDKLDDYLLSVEITSLIVGVVCFAWCIKRLITLILKLKPKNN